jgi:hypothetical protein
MLEGSDEIHLASNRSGEIDSRTASTQPERKQKSIFDIARALGSPTTENFTAEEENLRKSARWLLAPPGMKMPSGRKVSRAEMEGWKAQRRDDASNVSSCCDECSYNADWLDWGNKLVDLKTPEDGNQPERVERGKEKDPAASQKQNT